MLLHLPSLLCHQHPQFGRHRLELGEEEGLFKADAVNEEDPEREEEGSSALLCIARMRPGVRAVVCVIFGLEDSSAHAAVEPKTEGLSNLRFHGAGGVSSEPLLVS